MATKERGRAMAEALAVNSVLIELDLSSNAWDCSRLEEVHANGAGFAQELSKGLSNNEAMTSLNLSGNILGGHWGDESDWISDMSGLLIYFVVNQFG
jgi:hypothetical protein